MLTVSSNPGLASKLEVLEAHLPKILHESSPELQQVGEAFFFTRGKRIRPAVAMLSAEMAGYQGEEDVRLGVVVELIHLATLVHDDILDESRLRRGDRSVNFQWGNELAVLFGDYLYTKAMDEAIALGRLDVLQTLCGITVEMIQGELVQHYRRGAAQLTEEEHFDIIRRKTAQLFAGCARLGGRLADAPEETEEALWRFGLHFGMAFQLVDDLLDYTAREDILGKPMLGDLAEGKVTLPFLCFTDDGNPHLRRILRESLGDAEAVARHRDDILRMALESDGVGRVQAHAQAFAREAKNALETFPKCRARSDLETLAEFVLSRKK